MAKAKNPMKTKNDKLRIGNLSVKQLKDRLADKNLRPKEKDKTERRLRTLIKITNYVEPIEETTEVAE